MKLLILMNYFISWSLPSELFLQKEWFLDFMTVSNWFCDLERCEITTQKLSKVLFLCQPVSTRVSKQEKLNVFWHRCQVWDQSHGCPDSQPNQDTTRDHDQEKMKVRKPRRNFWINSICDLLMTHRLMTKTQHVTKMPPMKKLF